MAGPRGHTTTATVRSVRGGRGDTPSARSAAQVLVPLLAALPFLALAVQALGHSISLGSDAALVELGVRDVAHLHQFVGVYSRFGWHHPGPAWLALLSPAYFLLGGSSAALVASVAVLNAGFAALIAVAVRHLFDTARALLAVVAVLVFSLALGIGLFRVAWNPYAVLLPTVLFLICAWGALLDRRHFTWIAALVGSFIVQTHIGLLPLAATVLALVAGHRLRRIAKPEAGWLLVVAIWLPSLWDEAFGSGNLTALLRYFLQPHPLASWGETVGRVNGLLGRVFLSRVPDRLDRPLDGTGSWLVVAFAVVSGSLVVLGGRRHDRTVRLAGELGLAGLLAALLAAHSIVGPAQPYLLLWVCALPILPALAGLPLVAGRWPAAGAVPRVGVAAAAAVCAACLAEALVLPSSRALGDPAVARLESSVRPALPGPPQTVLLTLADHDAWPLSTGLALDLTRQGYRVVVPNAWLFMFGGRYRDECQPALEVRISGVTAAGGARGMSGEHRNRASSPPPPTAEIRPRAGTCR